jgi:tRNA(fMet)-specific endonuclease VapC
MIVLDTDHLRVLQSGGPSAATLEARLLAGADGVYTTVVTVHENVKGWQDELNRARTSAAVVEHYARLPRLLLFYSRWNVLPFDAAAAAEFDRLRALRLGRLNTLDLRIAAIARSRPTPDAVLLLTGEAAFTAVPGLRCEDWRHS